MHILCKLLYSVVVFIAVNCYALGRLYDVSALLWLMWIPYIWINIKPAFSYKRYQTRKLIACKKGCDLLGIFLISVTLSVIFCMLGLLGKLSLPGFSDNHKFWIIQIIIVFLAEALVFWNGMIRLYLFSSQLGIRWRVAGAICGMIPVVNLIVLMKILFVVEQEIKWENKKELVDEARKGEKVCRTKYPILMVHGVFFRDFRYLNYWGRIPKELEKNGAVIFYGNHQSAASVENSAKELDARIRQLVADTGCEKVNIIAHSKGGLDCRYALSMLGTDKYVASLTTVNTPHRGCEFADYLLTKIPEKQKQAIANTYNSALRKLGDTNPDFIAAVTDLTATVCVARNDLLNDVPGIYYRSIGSKLNKARGGRFPLNLTYLFVKNFDGYNDGLVGEASFSWGEDYRFVTAEGSRGISHGDIIDLNRENFKGFDVREFYVELVHELKEKGY